jgi:MoxR-like ATPase
VELADVRDVKSAVLDQVRRVVIGQEGAVDLLMVALLAEGHVLLEGVPGTAKTLLVQAFAACLSLPFKRIQFTPDLMPTDVTGTSLFNFQTNQFLLTKGPVFTSVLLADEINRTPPKTQSALLQAMQERVVTIDGRTHSLGDVFMVIATQNPVEQEGTYPLPEAQLDRFLFKVPIGYPSLEAEREMVRLHGRRGSMPRIADFQVAPVADLTFLQEARKLCVGVTLKDEIADYVVAIVRATRGKESLACGASPRSAAMLASAARARAALEGRAFVIPDDVKALAVSALGHRLLLAPDAEMEDVTTEGVLKQVLAEVPAPR